jgi:RNA polymerase sigma-70 factor (ECF subfamily)
VIDYRRRNKQEAMNTHLDALEGSDGGHMAVSHAGSVTTASAEDIYLAKEQSKLLADMIESLPDMYRLPIVLYHQQGLSYQEISEIVNEPMSKVKNRIFRARKILKENLMSMKRGESYVM